MKNKKADYFIEKYHCNLFMRYMFPQFNGIDSIKVSSEYYFYLCCLSVFLIQETDIDIEAALRILETIASKKIK